MPGTNLTREEALGRSKNIKNPNYNIVLDLTVGDKIFQSITTLTFDAEDKSSTFIDLIAESVNNITVNNEPIDITAFKDSRIEIQNLKKQNTVIIDANCLYTNTGEGLHRYVDPIDNEVYVYSQFEVPDARRVFSVFEQPDLKASFTFTVTTPKHWTVFSNSPTPTPKIEEDKATFAFTPTEIMSSYITAIVAGPYAGDTGTLTSTDGRIIPLGVYCSASLAKYLDSEEIMDITRKGFAFFETQFDCPYPFRKYDQIFVPEFNAGAMENAGCVTFRDSYVFKSRPTETMVERRAETILHELAHMWFGDLVTMQWWNDLWLNESFATFMSVLALVEGGTKWKDAWVTFNTAEKTWGYYQDQLPSTHPIVATIRDLQDVMVNFDGITYAKGASVLRQLVAYVGQKDFMDGIKNYFKKHQWKNATLDDFLYELEQTSGRDLKTWAKEWLEEAGVTILTPQIEADNGKITSLQVLQSTLQENVTLKSHRLGIGAYKLNNNTLERIWYEETDIRGAKTEIQVTVGKEEPDMLVLNDEDLTYAKLRLDPKSFETAINHINKIDNLLTKSIVLSSLWDMTRDGESKAQDFIKMALNVMPTIENPSQLTQILSQIKQCLMSYSAITNRKTLSGETADKLYSILEQAEPGSDTQLQIIKTWASLVSTPKQMDTLKAIYNKEMDVPGLKYDDDLLWHFLINLAACNKATNADIDARLKADPSLSGEHKAAGARTAIPTQEAKDLAWKTILHEQVSNDRLDYILACFYARADLQPELFDQYYTTYFENLQSIWKDREGAIAQAIVSGAYPLPLTGYLPAITSSTENWLKNNTDAPAALIRLICERQDEKNRILNCQNNDQ